MAAATAAFSLGIGAAASVSSGELRRASLGPAALSASRLALGGRRLPERASGSRVLALPREFSIRSNFSRPRSASSTKKAVPMASVGESTRTREVSTGELMPKTDGPLTMTYLEGNSWLWEVVGLKILIDPVLVGNLNFGIPWLYDGAKIKYRDFKLEDLPEIDYLSITQGFDDHCHDATLGPLSRLQPNMSVISSPNAEAILKKYFKKVTYLEPRGESTSFKASNGADVVIRATPGPILGPPWQRPENGYFIEVGEPKFTIYYEPHCVFENAKLDGESADVLVSPVIKQRLPGFTLVSGQEDAVKIAEFLKPKFVVTMKNGELDAKGILSKLVRTVGTTESFQELLAKKLPEVEVLQPVPGVPLEVPVA